MNSIINDIIKFETIYLYSNKKNNSIYEDFYQKNTENLLLNIFLTIKKNEKKIFKNKKFIIFEEKIKKTFNIDFDEMLKIKNIKELIILYMSIFIVLSLNSYSDKNLSEGKFKINTISECCNQVEYFFNSFEMWIKIRHDIYHNLVDIYNITKVFYLLIQEKIILEKNICYNNKTTKFIYIENMEYVSIKENYTTKFISFEYNKNIWLYNESFWSFTKIFKENFRSGEKFHIKDMDIINNLCENYFYIDLDNLEKIYSLFLEKNKINKDLIKEDYKIKIKEYSDNIYDLNKIKEISKKISIYLKCFNFENIIKNYKNNIKYYVPFKIDFRGRKYDMSEISPTFFSELRYCLHLGDYNLKKDIKYHFLNEKVNSIIIKYKNLINYRYKNIEEEKIISYIWY